MLGLGLLGLAVANRMLQALAVATLVVRARQWARPMLIYAVRDFLGFCIWAASYLGSDMRWRGEFYTFKSGGEIEKIATSRKGDLNPKISEVVTSNVGAGVPPVRGR